VDTGRIEIEKVGRLKEANWRRAAGKGHQETMADLPQVIHANRFIRVLDRDVPAGQVLTRAVKRRHIPVTLRPDYPASEANAGLANEDYLLLDPALTVAVHIDATTVEDVRSGLGYAGMTPQQRAAFLDWLLDPTGPAPLAFQELYLATLEVRLFEGDAIVDDAHRTLRSLQLEPSWHGNRGIERSILLGFWLRQDGQGLADWLATAPIATDLVSTALGLQALLHTSLSTGELAKIGAAWDQPALDAPAAVLKMRLASLTTTLGTEPLSYALDRLDESDCKPRPWRCAHRDLRISVPQPPVRAVLEPAIAELVAMPPQHLSDAAEAPEAVDGPLDLEDGTGGTKSKENYLILEFAHSRSEYLDYVLQLAQRQTDFTQLMDEDRRLVYRVRYRKDKLRNFWRIWEYVQNWSSTKVYVNGEEIEQWKIWPYSQYLR
jgi:hypothetical protein